MLLLRWSKRVGKSFSWHWQIKEHMIQSRNQMAAAKRQTHLQAFFFFFRFSHAHPCGEILVSYRYKMAKIQRLDEAVINRIAAGEVRYRVLSLQLIHTEQSRSSKGLQMLSKRCWKTVWMQVQPLCK